MKNKLLILILCMLIPTLCACGNNSSDNSTNNTERQDDIITQSSTGTEGSHSENESVQSVSETESKQEVSSGIESKTDESNITQNNSTNKEDTAMQMKINDTTVSVKWENNKSVQALKELCTEKPLIIRMSMYGGFEQVGSIGTNIPRNDVQTTTQAGDIVLYSGNQLVVFYGSNSWAYTRLGHITGITENELSSLLGNGNVTITLN